MTSDSSYGAVVTIAVATSLRHAVSLAITFGIGAESPRFPPPTVVADATSRPSGADGFGQLVVRHLAQYAREVNIVVPDRSLAGLAGRALGRKQNRISVDVGSRSERVSTVLLPGAIVEAGSLVAVNDVRRDPANRPTLAIGLWSRFAGLRERIGVRLAKPDEGLAAEIALAVRPALLLVADTWRGYPVVIATADQIAAELAGLAVRQVRRSGEDDVVGPWQDPLVQRATELDLGVRLPEQIAIRLAWAEGGDSRMSEDGAALLKEVAVRLGVRDATGSALTPHPSPSEGS